MVEIISGILNLIWNQLSISFVGIWLIAMAFLRRFGVFIAIIGATMVAVVLTPILSPLISLFIHG